VWLSGRERERVKEEHVEAGCTGTSPYFGSIPFSLRIAKTNPPVVAFFCMYLPEV
jgi:hypothetical protein